MEEVVALVCFKLNGGFEPQKLVLDSFRDDELVVRMVATGGITPAKFPFVGGHEGAGIVEQVGSKISHIAPGDHVLLSFSSCEKCARCLNGIPAYCSKLFDINFKMARLDGTTAWHTPSDSVPIGSHFFGQSSFATKIVARGCSAVKVDKDIPLSILCSFGCGMQTGAGTVLNVLRPPTGSKIAIFGVGAVGMAGVMAARITPAATIIAIDIVETKLELARHFGATNVINSARQNPVEEILRLTGELGVDCAFDATGNIDVIRAMLAATAPGGLAVTVGASPTGTVIEIEPGMWLSKGVKYMGAHQGSSVPQKFIPLLIQFYKTGRFPVDQIITKYPYQDIEKAHEDAASGNCIKAVIEWP
ncbi:uncharacterized protein A1O9_03767 [Exophiala aquamarina CBS 119918]|uniref:Enoyl reductase (ER) domain-containing protein n=1 Tax=Exophiala aquamarina CBS 119918 TaxID=1182545 RepID=A0A072PFM8_9EURO|nr:uncharacterized protein A1O9_03767 [Exophiala aquamarina CBS 119918]KEF58924.1 hypothetical protein A1O9_03767 [Exophiala aquamarina CBS 119918]